MKMTTRKGPVSKKDKGATPSWPKKKRKHVHRWEYVNGSYPITVECECGRELDLMNWFKYTVPITEYIRILNTYERNKQKGKKR